MDNINAKKITKLLLILTCFLSSLSSCKHNDSDNEIIEEKIITIIKKDGWLFQSSMGCDQLSNYSSDWSVKGNFIPKDSLIAIYIRKSYEYKNHPRHTDNINFQKLKSIYHEKFDEISKRIENQKYTKFGILYYEGRYDCENGVNIQKDTIPVMFTNNYNIKEYVELGMTPGP